MTERKFLLAFFILIGLLSLAITAAAQVTDENLRSELLAMRDLDQKVRDECSGNADELLKCYMKMSENVDK
ncbi:MAG TPA: hypothetical protein VHQ01_06980, partial [Pyrinomonadaceae bacterium]|nr:hypothetical protein [Pyrinomonadaceae bacterium]